MVSLKNVRLLPARRSKVFGVKGKKMFISLSGSRTRDPFGSEVATESLHTNSVPQGAIYLLWCNFRKAGRQRPHVVRKIITHLDLSGTKSFYGKSGGVPAFLNRNPIVLGVTLNKGQRGVLQSRTH